MFQQNHRALLMLENQEIRKSIDDITTMHHYKPHIINNIFSIYNNTNNIIDYVRSLKQ